MQREECEAALRGTSDGQHAAPARLPGGAGDHARVRPRVRFLSNNSRHSGPANGIHPIILKS